MVIDPVCQAEIDPSRAAAKVRYGEEVYYFCSDVCHRRFLMEPGDWLAALEEDEEDERAVE
jgi:Cu+-exporting ATPase